MNNTTNAYNKEFNSEIDNLMRELANMQITCMTLRYLANIKMREKNDQNSLIMLATARKTFEMLEAESKKIMESVTEEEFNDSFERVGFEKILFNNLIDEAIEANKDIFPMPPRPEGKEYSCDKIAFEMKSRMLELEYFSTLLIKKAN